MSLPFVKAWRSSPFSTRFGGASQGRQGLVLGQALGLYDDAQGAHLIDLKSGLRLGIFASCDEAQRFADLIIYFYDDDGCWRPRTYQRLAQVARGWASSRSYAAGPTDEHVALLHRQRRDTTTTTGPSAQQLRAYLEAQGWRYNEDSSAILLDIGVVELRLKLQSEVIRWDDLFVKEAIPQLASVLGMSQAALIEAIECAA